MMFSIVSENTSDSSQVVLFSFSTSYICQPLTPSISSKRFLRDDEEKNVVIGNEHDSFNLTNTNKNTQKKRKPKQTRNDKNSTTNNNQKRKPNSNVYENCKIVKFNNKR